VPGFRQQPAYQTAALIWSTRLECKASMFSGVLGARWLRGGLVGCRIDDDRTSFGGASVPAILTRWSTYQQSSRRVAATRMERVGPWRGALDLRAVRTRSVRPPRHSNTLRRTRLVEWSTPRASRFRAQALGLRQVYRSREQSRPYADSSTCAAVAKVENRWSAPSET
jgi:hypothetical protein